MDGIMKPILFNTEMVKAILEGRKTVTRRIIKPAPRSSLVFDGQHWCEVEPWAGGNICCHVPPHQAGDILYVRETWRFTPCDCCGLGRAYPCSAPQAMFDNREGCFDYRASAVDDDAQWHPSGHMPRQAARIFLKVKSVRAERLQMMSVKDAWAEGVEGLTDFAALWDSGVKKADRDTCGWRANPWVWAVEFQLYRGEY